MPLYSIGGTEEGIYQTATAAREDLWEMSNGKDIVSSILQGGSGRVYVRMLPHVRVLFFFNHINLLCCANQTLSGCWWEVQSPFRWTPRYVSSRCVAAVVGHFACRSDNEGLGMDWIWV